MISARNYIFSRLLLTTFVVGSVLAPASHYAFMLFSEAYGMHLMMVSGRTSAESEVGDESHTIRVVTYSETRDISHVDPAGMDGHGGCLYWSLIASLLLAEPAAQQSVHPVGSPTHISIAGNETSSGRAVYTFPARGPPVV